MGKNNNNKESYKDINLVLVPKEQPENFIHLQGIDVVQSSDSNDAPLLNSSNEIPSADLFQKF